MMISPKTSFEIGRFRTRFRAVPFIVFRFGLRLVEVPLRFRTVPHMKNHMFQNDDCRTGATTNRLAQSFPLLRRGAAPPLLGSIYENT